MRSLGCAIGVAALLLAAAPRSWSGGQEAKEARALLDKAIQAHGGEANLAKVKAIYFRGGGHVRVGGDFPMTAELHAQGTTHMKFVADVNVNGMNIRLIKVINGDKAAVGLRISREGFRDVSLYFDKTSHLLLKSEINVKDGGNEVLQEIYYSGHKLIDGVQHAHKWSAKRDGKPFVDVEFTEITVHQQKLDDSIFDKP